MKKKSRLKAALAGLALLAAGPMATAGVQATATATTPTGQKEITVNRVAVEDERVKVEPRKRKGGHLGYFPHGSPFHVGEPGTLKYGHPKRHFNKKRHGRGLRRAHARA